MTNIADAAALGLPRSRRSGTKTRRRFLILSIAALAVLATALGVSFTADTGVTTITGVTSGGTSALVYTPTYGSPGSLPAAITAGGANGWKYGTGTSTSTPTTPTFSTIVAGTAAKVTGSGDVALIDATDTSSNDLLVTVYITNMQALGLTYNSYSLPIRIYSGTASTGSITWGASPVTDANGLDTSTTYLTNTAGFETFKVATGSSKYYEVTLDSGGSLYPFQTGASGAATAPALYITSQRSS